ncbi:SLAM family member 8-like [Mixophyes fleayi]|uniref:SLAM family member 8-like n=1 Tax=Mixophyes fleayi TaxID=3061075 RepID=UPI003F4D87B3
MLSSMLTLLLVVHAGTICTTETVIQITGTQGQSTLLSPELPPGFNTRDVFWRHLSPTDHLVASFSRGSSDITYQSCFHGRVRLLHNFTLEIQALELKDTGVFTCQMVDTEGHMRLLHFHLTVYEVVAKPEVQVFMFRGSKDCSVFLSCNTTAGTNVTYSWMIKQRHDIPLNTTYPLFDDNRLLKFLLTDTDREVSFTCTVTNPVSQEQTTVMPWTSCSFQQGTDFGVYSSKIILYIAGSLVVMFISMMFCVYLCTRNSVKYNLRKRQRNVESAVQQEDETVLQWNEETAAQQNEWTIQHDAVTEVQHNQGTTLRQITETIV